MDTISTRLQQLEVLVQSIVGTLEAEKEAVVFAQQKLELVHPPFLLLLCFSIRALSQDRQRVVDSDARQSDMVKLDVGGSYFHVSRKVLTTQPDCLLESLFSGRFRIEAQADGSIFLDR